MKPRVMHILFYGVVATISPLFAQDGGMDERDREIERLKQMVYALEARVAELERSSEVRVEDSGDAFRGERNEPAGFDAPAGGRVLAAGLASSGAERVEAEDPAAAVAAVKEKEAIDFKGALRYNLILNDQNDDTKYGDTGFDLFRVGAEGSYDNILLSAEYRFYSYMNTLHHGWIGYDFSEAGQLRLGVSQVPFGILPYASHNFWFGAPYYLGLSDDYDLGVKWTDNKGPWRWDLAFYKNAELGSPGNLNRYSFDLVTAGPGQANEETNQFNGRAVYTLGEGTDSIHEIGVSAQAGQIYNSLTDDSGHHWAFAAHLDSRYKRWNLQLELARYEYAPKNPIGVSDDTVRLGAFATSYDISSKATVGVANVAYNLPVRIPGIDQVLLYNDFSIVMKDPDGFDDSMLNTTGAAVGMGPLFLYFDLIHARNMVFFGDGSLAGEGDDAWRSRFNVNLGYYW